MNTENLKQSLKNLHQSLEAATNLDPELQALLHTLEDDIQALLAQQPAEPAMTPEPAPELTPAPEPILAPDADKLVERAQEISARFAVRYPHVEPILRELADTLARMGI